MTFFSFGSLLNLYEVAIPKWLLPFSIDATKDHHIKKESHSDFSFEHTGNAENINAHVEKLSSLAPFWYLLAPQESKGKGAY